MLLLHLRDDSWKVIVNLIDKVVAFVELPKDNILLRNIGLYADGVTIVQTVPFVAHLLTGLDDELRLFCLLFVQNQHEVLRIR